MVVEHHENYYLKSKGWNMSGKDRRKVESLVMVGDVTFHHQSEHEAIRTRFNHASMRN